MSINNIHVTRVQKSIVRKNHPREVSVSSVLSVDKKNQLMKQIKQIWRVAMLSQPSGWFD